uniref:Uncharacterized protein n=1 Tax=Octopus bimaculoides TaxID=37653 RepID=A0A0L8I7A5_OCTBM
MRFCNSHIFFKEIQIISEDGDHNYIAVLPWPYFTFSIIALTIVCILIINVPHLFTIVLFLLLQPFIFT